MGNDRGTGRAGLTRVMWPWADVLGSGGPQWPICKWGTPSGPLPTPPPGCGSREGGMPSQLVVSAQTKLTSSHLAPWHPAAVLPPGQGQAPQ